MPDLTQALKPYDLATALASDRREGCLVIDVGSGADTQSEGSLQRVVDCVAGYLHQADTPTFAATKLYVVGDWTASDSHNFETSVEVADEWDVAIKHILELLKQTQSLQELTWVSGLPFTAPVCDELPASLTKLILDLGYPVRLDHEGDVLHRSYITSNEMQPLQEQTQLKELRLFNVHNSFQPIIWETVFRNTSPGAMRILEVQMAVAPIVRSEEWKKAKDVMGLTVATEESGDKHYKGLDGKGVLHFLIGTGEYLDSLCIRLARIAAGLDESTPLPLWGLKLDGFVLDHLPFEHELSQIVFLECGDNCIDSGLRAPKIQKAPHNKWSKTINNAASHCLIKWPNWTGIFDAGGHQRNKSGDIILQEIGLSTPIDDCASSPVVPLTEESLNMKALNDALMPSTETDYSTGSPTLPRSSADSTPIDATSNVSVRGSDVPTPTVASAKTAHSPTVSPVDNSDVAVLTSFADPEIAEAEEVIELTDVPDLDDSSVPTSAFSSFGKADTPTSDIASNIATAGSSTPAVDEEELVSTIEQKVRTSSCLVPSLAS